MGDAPLATRQRWNREGKESAHAVERLFGGAACTRRHSAMASSRRAQVEGQLTPE